MKLLSLLEETVFGASEYGDNFGLAREDEWTYYFGDVPVLDMEHKTGEVPRWLATFYHGTRPDPDEGGPWPNNTLWEAFIGPVAVAILAIDDKLHYISAHVVKGSEDEYKLSEQIVTDPAPTPPEAFTDDLLDLARLVDEATANAIENEAGEGDAVYFEHEDGRVLVGVVESIGDDTVVIQVVPTFRRSEEYGGSYWSDLPEKVDVTPDKLFPVPVSGFGYEG